MSTTIYINLPVKDLAASTGFFTDLGYGQNTQISDDNASCIVFSDDICAMLLVEPFFQTFTSKAIADASTTTGAIMALAVDSREQVDELADKALSLGAQKSVEPTDEGFFYARSFFDLDGHAWEFVWTDPNAAEG